MSSNRPRAENEAYAEYREKLKAENRESAIKKRGYLLNAEGVKQSLAFSKKYKADTLLRKSKAKLARKKAKVN